MIKKAKKNNILKYSKLRSIIKKRDLKINMDSLNNFSFYIDGFLDILINNIAYDLKVEGRKSIKPNDIKKAVEKLRKEDNFYEV